MVRHKQPPRLSDLCQAWFSRHLGEKVLTSATVGLSGVGHEVGVGGAAKHQTLSLVRLKLRPFFMEQLPVCVRSELLEETSEFLIKRSLASGI